MMTNQVTIKVRQSKGQKHWCQNSNLRSPMHTWEKPKVRISLKQADQSKHGHTNAHMRESKSKNQLKTDKSIKAWSYLSSPFW